MGLFESGFRLGNEQLNLRPSLVSDAEKLFQIADPQIRKESSTEIFALEDMEKYLKKAVQDRQHKTRQQLTIINTINYKVLLSSHLLTLVVAASNIFL